MIWQRERIANPSKNDLKKFTEECGIEVKSDTDVFNLAGCINNFYEILY